MSADPFDKSCQQQVDAVDDTHHCVDTRSDRQRSLQQLVKCVDYMTDSIVDAFLRRLFLCQLCMPDMNSKQQNM